MESASSLGGKHQYKSAATVNFSFFENWGKSLIDEMESASSSGSKHLYKSSATVNFFFLENWYK